jgi:pyrroline-5-carboxylate reductase
MTSSQKITGTIGFLGFGNMGKAIAEGVVAKGVSSVGSILIKDPGLPADVAQALGRKGYRFAQTDAELFKQSDVILLAIKPQVVKEQRDALAGVFEALSGTGKTIISIMAGIKAPWLREFAPRGSNVIRVMPNLGLSVGEGATAIATDGVGDFSIVETIFQSCGTTVRVTEDQIDAVTAVSGSGPMYLFEFVGAMTEAGVKAGLEQDVAYKLAIQTAKGSLKLLESSSDTPDTWTKRVCSPGGTTLAALGVLQSEGFHGILERAVLAAKKRSIELS